MCTYCRTLLDATLQSLWVSWEETTDGWRSWSWSQGKPTHCCCILIASPWGHRLPNFWHPSETFHNNSQTHQTIHTPTPASINNGWTVQTHWESPESASLLKFHVIQTDPQNYWALNESSCKYRGKALVYITSLGSTVLFIFVILLLPVQ